MTALLLISHKMLSQTEIRRFNSLYAHILIEYPEIYVQLRKNLDYLHM